MGAAPGGRRPRGERGDGRLSTLVPIRTGIPQVVVPGAAECFNFGARDTVPAEFDTEERNIIIHNPNVTSLLATPEEMRRLGEYIADHVNRAPGPKAVALPLRGLDNYFKEGSQWHGVDVTPLLDSLRTALDPSVEVVEMENNINDEAFADAVFELFQKQWEQRGAAAAPAASAATAG